MAHTRQSRPVSGLGFQVKVFKPFQVAEVVPDSPGSGLVQPGGGVLPRVSVNEKRGDNGLGLGVTQRFLVEGLVTIPGFGFQVSGSGCRVSGSGFHVSGFRFRVSGLGFRVSGFGFRV